MVRPLIIANGFAGTPDNPFNVRQPAEEGRALVTVWTFVTSAWMMRVGKNGSRAGPGVLGMVKTDCGTTSGAGAGDLVVGVLAVGAE